MLPCPLTIREANAFVARYHRHARPSQGGKFALGVSLGANLVGVVIVGRPIARELDDGLTAEILRVATDGTRNACSFLYSRAARIAWLMGYTAVLTYTLDRESGASLRAVGAVPVAKVPARSWAKHSVRRPRKHQAIYDETKIRWEL